MQSFLREKAEMDHVNYERSLVLHGKFFAEEYVASLPRWHAKMGPETFVGVEACDTCTHVFTAVTFAGQELRFRYLLKLSGSDWQICAKETGCMLCQGTGRKGSGDCPLCRGAGWKDYGPQSA